MVFILHLVQEVLMSESRSLVSSSSTETHHSRQNKKTFQQKAWSTFNWIYTSSPITFQTFTGWHHPIIPRFTGGFFTGQYWQYRNDEEAVSKMVAGAQMLAKSTSRKLSYFNMFSYDQLVVNKPSDAVQLLKFNYKKTDDFDKLGLFDKGFAKEGEKTIFGEDIGEAWKSKRMTVVHFVGHPTLKAMMPDYQDVLTSRIKKIEETYNREVDGEEFTTFLTMDIIGRRLGLYNFPDTVKTKLSLLLNEAIGHMARPKSVVNLMISRNAMIKKLGLADYFSPDEMTKRKEQAHDIVASELLPPNKTKILSTDNFLRARFEEEAKNNKFESKESDEMEKIFNITTPAVIAKTLEVLTVGHETTAKLIFYALCELNDTNHKEIKLKLQKELDTYIETSGKTPDKWTLDDFNSLPMLARVVKEALRVKPPVSVIKGSTKTNQTITLGDLGDTVPKTETEYKEAMKKRDTTQDVVLQGGTGFFFPTRDIHMDEHYYGKDASQFNPDRFVDFTPKPYTFMPFGFPGARECPGQHFADMEARVAIARLMALYDISIKEIVKEKDVYIEKDVHHPFKSKDIMTSRPAQTIRFVFTPRNTMKKEKKLDEVELVEEKRSLSIRRGS